MTLKFYSLLSAVTKRKKIPVNSKEKWSPKFYFDPKFGCPDKEKNRVFVV
jgi:hypothetical protein